MIVQKQKKTRRQPVNKDMAGGTKGKFVIGTTKSVGRKSQYEVLATKGDVILSNGTTNTENGQLIDNGNIPKPAPKGFKMRSEMHRAKAQSINQPSGIEPNLMQKSTQIAHNIVTKPAKHSTVQKGGPSGNPPIIQRHNEAINVTQELPSSLNTSENMRVDEVGGTWVEETLMPIDGPSSNPKPPDPGDPSSSGSGIENSLNSENNEEMEWNDEEAHVAIDAGMAQVAKDVDMA
ncbi:hypothetical protein PIB30_096416 [Stylosanthes scabra]|uniref:Uncharacterized protein n=1 Tax=Stylosanthes scabra TaxID=79078 RepID=A0ABU6UYH1_9FABA|nr:hypothetical protein [Stylosanthes scabra]